MEDDNKYFYFNDERPQVISYINNATSLTPHIEISTDNNGVLFDISVLEKGITTDIRGKKEYIAPENIIIEYDKDNKMYYLHVFFDDDEAFLDILNTSNNWVKYNKEEKNNGYKQI
jgi:hypothetical protein